MVLEIVGMLLVVIILAVIINGVDDYCRQRKRVNMSFKEAMDLVDLPVITFYNNGKKFNFLLDTGATMSVIDSNVLSNLSHENLDDAGSVYGMEGNRIEVSYVKARTGATSSEDNGIRSSPFTKRSERYSLTSQGAIGGFFLFFEFSVAGSLSGTSNLSSSSVVSSSSSVVSTAF